MDAFVAWVFKKPYLDNRSHSLVAFLLIRKLAKFRSGGYFSRWDLNFCTGYHWIKTFDKPAVWGRGGISTNWNLKKFQPAAFIKISKHGLSSTAPGFLHSSLTARLTYNIAYVLLHFNICLHNRLLAQIFFPVQSVRSWTKPSDFFLAKKNIFLPTAVNSW